MMLESLKSLYWADYIYYLLVDSKKLYGLIDSSRRVLNPVLFLIPLLLVVEQILMVSLWDIQSEFFYTMVTVGTVYSFITIAVEIIVYAAMVDALFQLTGKEGRFKYILTIYLYSLFPRLFLLPVIYVIQLINFDVVFLNYFFYFLFWSLLSIWGLIIFIQNISEMHSQKPGKCFFIAIAPHLVGFFLKALTIILLFTLFIKKLGTL